MSQMRCWNHAHREAAARCPACGRLYCRECVAEHRGRLLCQGCLKSQEEGGREGSGLLGKTMAIVGLAVSLTMVWLFFRTIGSWLRALPEDYHRSPAEYFNLTEDEESEGQE